MGKLNLIVFCFMIICTKLQGQEKIYFTMNCKEIYTKETLKTLFEEKRKKEKKYFVFIENKIVKRNDSIIKHGIILASEIKIKESDSEGDGTYELLSKKLPDFSLELYKGGYINNSDLIGKPTIINLWFTTCVPCVWEIDDLNELKKEYGDKLNYLGITHNDRATIYKFFETHKYDFTILINAKKFITEKLLNYSYPKLILVDKEGIIQYVTFGIPQTKSGKEISLKMLKKEIDELIEK